MSTHLHMAILIGTGVGSFVLVACVNQVYVFLLRWRDKRTHH
ncbi:hypothetical protein [Kribbella deserti]|uniref:Uncharacterized protein n=1 Tax=Kribbella deserti TaxID=1926257 RepID=A0ABV6QX16_9ACTN